MRRARLRARLGGWGLLVGGWGVLALLGPAGAQSLPGQFDVTLDPAWRVADEEPIEAPRADGWNWIQAFLDEAWRWPADDLLALRRGRPPADLNALGEVPASSWFTPRHAPGDAPAPWRPSREAIARAYQEACGGGLARGTALTVEAARLAGEAPYLWLRAPDGTAWRCEPDAPQAPRRRTAAAVIASRLLHACGYPVGGCAIAILARDDLTLGADARCRGEFGGTKGLTAEELDRFFARAAGPVAREDPVPQLRVAATRLPAGLVLGPWPARGTRRDDPNDRIAHQDRRSLRALELFAAWLSLPDLGAEQTVDVYRTETGSVGHYLVGLSGALQPPPPSVTAGHMPQGFAGLPRGSAFDPHGWALTDPYAPCTALQWGDALWALRQMLALVPAEIRAAVAEAGYGDPQVEAYVTGELLARRDRLARAWLGRVNAAVACAIAEDAPGRWVLTCRDLGIDHHLRQPEDVAFVMTLHQPWPGVVRGRQSRGGGAVRFDLAPFMPPEWLHRRDPHRYALAEIRSWDYTGRMLTGTLRVHLYFDREQGPRIVGIERP